MRSAPKVDFRRELAGLRLEVGMFDAFYQAYSNPAKLNESVQESNYLYAPDPASGKKVFVGLNGVKLDYQRGQNQDEFAAHASNIKAVEFDATGNLPEGGKFKLDDVKDQRNKNQREQYFPLDASPINHRQAAIYAGLAFNCSQHPTLETMMGEDEFKTAGKTLPKGFIRVAEVNELISHRLFRNLGVSVDKNGDIHTTQDLIAVKKAYDAVARLIELYNAPLDKKQFSNKDREALEKVLSTIHAILEHPNNNTPNEIFRVIEAEYKNLEAAYFQKASKKSVNPEPSVYQQGLLNILSGRNYNETSTKVKDINPPAQPQAPTKARSAPDPRTAAARPAKSSSMGMFRRNQTAPIAVNPEVEQLEKKQAGLEKEIKLLQKLASNPDISAKNREESAEHMVKLTTQLNQTREQIAEAKKGISPSLSRK